MKICILSDFCIPHHQGGGERRYYAYAKLLVKQGHRVDWVCMGIKDVPNKELLDGIRIIHIGPKIKRPPHRSIPAFIHFIYSAFFYLMCHKYDVVDAQTYCPLIPARLASIFTKVPLVAVIHDISHKKSDQWMNFAWLAKIIEKMIYKLKYDQIITVSNPIKKRLIKEYGINSNRINVVHNGVDLTLIDSVRAKKAKKNRIIYVGRLIPHKHVEDAIKIMKNINADLIIIGSGPCEKGLKNFAKRLHLDNKVRFLGSLNDYKNVIKEIKKSHILILPSTREGFGMVLAEAMAGGVVPIAYYSDGVIDVITDGITGFLIEQRNSKKMAEKINYLLKNIKVTKKVTIEGEKFVKKNFVWDSLVLKIIKVYEKAKI